MVCFWIAVSLVFFLAIVGCSVFMPTSVHTVNEWQELYNDS